MTPEQELRTTITELWYELYPESKRLPENDDKAALLRVKNIVQDLKDTRWNYRVLNNAWNKLNEEMKK